MENEILFSEIQKFKQRWLWIILFGINGLLVFTIIKRIILGHQFGDKLLGNLGFYIAFIITLFLTILIYNLCLDTQLKKDGIYVRFFPFHQTFRFFPWEKIDKLYVRQYNPVTEYGGWGIRIGLFGKGKAFNVSGNKGLQIEFHNEERLLIGTNKPDELIKALNKIRKFKNETYR